MSFLNPESVVSKLPIEEGMTVVDLGAGRGEWIIPLAKKVGEKGRVIAVDVNPDLTSAVKANARQAGFSNVEISTGDIEAKDGSRISDFAADIVILSNVLFLSEDREAVIAEAKRILKSRGYALVVDWKDSVGGLGPRKDHLISGEAVQKLFLGTGFTLYNEIDAGEHHFAYLFKKLDRQLFSKQ